MADNTDKILQLAGWTREEIALLINEGICPDHWTSKPIPTFALLEVIRSAVDASENSYRQGLPPILKSLGLQQPQILTGVIAKVERYVAKAEKSNDFLLLMQEMKELSKSQADEIGPACSKIGVTPEWLNNNLNTQTCTETITNQVIVEIQQYCKRKGITWKTVHDVWWPKLFPGTSVPNIQTIARNWDLLAERKKTISRNCTKDEKETFLQTPYILAQSRPPKQMPKGRVKKNMVTMRRLSGGVLTVEKVKLMDVLRHPRASRASAGIDGNAKPSGPPAQSTVTSSENTGDERLAGQSTITSPISEEKQVEANTYTADPETTGDEQPSTSSGGQRIYLKLKKT
eukprot:XP_003731209.1 PREDICTED: uncharacterized protein LOC100893480 isoform X1 [Strongylocentrotus purpuratus]